jgi:hypothetical protein
MATTTPVPSRLMVAESPMRSTTVAPTAKPSMLPRIAVLVTQPAAVARTLVGNSSERWAAKVGVHIEAPALARRMLGANSHPLLRL